MSSFAERVVIVTDFLDGIGDLDFDRVGGHLADDAVMWLPFVEALPPVTGRSEIVERLRATVPLMFERMVFTYDAWYDVRDQDALVAEYHSECPQKGGTAVYRNSYITIFRFEGDRISLYKEYLNPEKMAAFAAQAGGG